MARPTKFQKQYIDQAEKLTAKGASPLEVAEFFNVSLSTYYDWKNTHKEFSEAIERGRQAVCDLVEGAMLQRALGYTMEVEKQSQYTGEVRAMKVPVIPDVRAQESYLAAKRPEVWSKTKDLTVGNITIQVLVAGKDGETKELSFDDPGGDGSAAVLPAPETGSSS